MNDWKYVGGGVIDGEEVLIYINNVTHEITEVPIGVRFDLALAL